MRKFQRNLQTFAENIRKFAANFQKICPKKPGTLNRYAGEEQCKNSSRVLEEPLLREKQLQNRSFYESRSAQKVADCALPSNNFLF